MLIINFIFLRPVRVVVEEINVTQKAISKIENSTEKPEEIAKQYQEKLDKHHQSAEVMKSLDDNARELQRAAEKRKRHYKLTRDFFITYIQHSFANILEFRQFKVFINHYFAFIAFAINIVHHFLIK